MKRVAVIDLGTNTFNLLVVEGDGAKVKRLENLRRVVKLGEGGLAQKRIMPIPYQRGLNALSELVDIARDLSADEIHALATSGIRSTVNGADFVGDAQSKTNICIQTISGDEEARLIYKGAMQAVTDINYPVLVMDIGGGSTEFILGNNQGIIWKQSFQIGVSRLMEHFQPADPITPSELEEINDHLSDTLAPLLDKCKEINPVMMIGSAGSFDSFAQMLSTDRTDELDLNTSTSYRFDLDRLATLHQQLIQSTYAQRLEMPGLVKMRADMIVLSSVQLQFVLNAVNLDQVSLSTYSMKEGYAAELLQEH